MGEFFRRSGIVILMAGLVGASTAGFPGLAEAQSQSEPPARVARLAFVNGTVSFHDDQASDWTQATINTPLTTGDALWTEPNARSEVSLAGTRVRMDSGTELDMLAIDDTQTRMQLNQGRIDVRAFTMDTSQPYQVITPRGTVTLQQQGDYYVLAGSEQDPTQLGVRSGAAQIQASNGQVLAVRAGEIGEVSGDNATPQLHTIASAPPPMPAYWVDRDRQVVYDQPPQYVSAGMTGYEDLNAYGGWSNDPEYGEVWAPRTVPTGWEPYRTGHWSNVQPWGWTWVDDQPWGFAPYHYGRWAKRNNRWVWVPPQRDLHPVYAPALVAFVGGTELGVAIGQQSRQPVGWFPLGPREPYVPSYTANHDYYRRLNLAARVPDQVMENRWQGAQRHEAITANQQGGQQAAQQAGLMNRRFATVVSAQDFANSRPVARALIQAPADRLAAAPVAPVAAPPAPTMSIRAIQAPGNPPNAAQPNATRPNAGPANAPRGPAQANVQAHGNLTTTQTPLANMQAIAKPADAQRPSSPGPKFAATTPATPNNASGASRILPPLAPRSVVAPPPTGHGPAQPEANKATPPSPAATPQPGPGPHPQANNPATPPRPGEPQQRPAEQHATPPQPTQANQPPRPGEVHAPQAQPQQAAPPPARPEPPRQPENRATPERQGQAPAPQPPHPAAPPPPQQAHTVAPPPPPQHQAAPPPPQQAHAPAPPPQPQHQAAPPAPPAPQQAHAPAPQPQPHPAPAPAPAQKKDEEKK